MKNQPKKKIDDTQRLIGTILDESVQRDAIHIAVVPLTAGEPLSRGQEIGLAYGTTDVAVYKCSDYGCQPIGIVDPFLKRSVKKGQRFFAFLFPGTVTGIRHHWRHPAFDDPLTQAANEHEDWLRRFAERWNMDYNEMLAAALDETEYGGVAVARGIGLHGGTDLDYGDEDLFWKHVEGLMNRTFDSEHRERLRWSCTC